MWYEADAVSTQTTCRQKRRSFYAKIKSHAVMGTGRLPDLCHLLDCRFFRFSRHR